jgi:hypothetical protein
MMVYNKLINFQFTVAIIIGGITALVLNFFYPDKAIQIFIIVTGISLLIIDLRYRDKRKEYADYGYQETFLRFLTPTGGGSLMFIPTWIIGTGLIIWGIVGKF